MVIWCAAGRSPQGNIPIPRGRCKERKRTWTGPDGAVVAAEVPGVAPEDIDITIRRDVVTLRGNRPAVAVEEGAVVQREERMHGAFARTIVLPFRVDADKASARFENGVVSLTLPRPEDDKPHQIKVTRS